MGCVWPPAHAGTIKKAKKAREEPPKVPGRGKKKTIRVSDHFRFWTPALKRKSFCCFFVSLFLSPSGFLGSSLVLFLWFPVLFQSTFICSAVICASFFCSCAYCFVLALCLLCACFVLALRFVCGRCCHPFLLLPFLFCSGCYFRSSPFTRQYSLVTLTGSFSSCRGFLVNWGSCRVSLQPVLRLFWAAVST